MSKPKTVDWSPLRRARFEIGDPSLRKVARDSGIDAGTLSKLEAGVTSTRLNYTYASRLSPVLGKTSAQLLAAMADWYDRREAAPRKRGRARRAA